MAKKVGETSILIVDEAHSTSDLAVAPQYCSFVVNEKFLLLVANLLDICEMNSISQVNVSMTPQYWGTKHIEQDARLNSGELIVCASGQFWFTEESKEYGGFFESEVIDVAWMINVIQADSAQIIFANEDVKEAFEGDVQ